MNPFEKIFGYREQKREIANKKLDEIEKKYAGIILLPDDQSLSELIDGDVPTINKLLMLNLDELSDSSDSAYSVNEEYKLNLDIDDNTGKMCIKSKKDAKSFVALVNDDFLQSSMTGKKYAAHSKKNIKAT